ncbi:MAG: DNA pilot protein [Microvirus sp.]|nr:MAG: DNA pilot protein [Microvirus sp.]
MFGIDDMAMATGLSAGASLVGGMVGQGGAQATNAAQINQSNLAASFNANTVRDQENWQAQMSNTAYVRAMQDMKNAGLNPILAANLGGATTPTGGAATMAAPNLSNPGSAMQAGISSAGQAAAVGAGVKATLAQADKDNTAGELNKAGVRVADETVKKTAQDTRTGAANERLADASAMTKTSEALLNAANAGSAAALARVNNRVADDTTAFGDSPISKGIGGLMRILNTIQNAPTSGQAGALKLPSMPTAPAAVGSVQPPTSGGGWNFGAFKPAGGDNPIVQERIRQNRLKGN